MASILNAEGLAADNGNFTVSAGTGNRRGVIFATLEADTAPTSVSINFGGQTPTFKNSYASNNGGGTEQYVYVFDVTEAQFAALTPGSIATSATVNGGGGVQGKQLVYVQADQCSASALVVTGAGNSSATSPIATTANPAGAGAIIVACAAQNSSGSSSTAGNPSGSTKFYDTADGGGDSRAVGQYKTSASTGSQAVDINIPAIRAAIGAVVFEAASGGTSITPTAGSLSLTGQTASVSNSLNVTRTPTAGSLGFTGSAPTLTLTVAAPVVGSLAITGQAPTLVVGTIRVPTAGSLAFTGTQPSVANSGGSRSISPSAGSLSFGIQTATIANSGAAAASRRHAPVRMGGAMLFG